VGSAVGVGLEVEVDFEVGPQESAREVGVSGVD
jgi:hypothetical protein